MGNFFGKKRTSRVTEHDKAVLQIKDQRDKLKQYQTRIESKLEAEKSIAKKLLQNGQRERAKLLLKKKRYQEQLLQKTDGQLDNLEKMIHDLEFSQIEIEVVNGLKIGNEALKKMNDILNIDEIERIMDETQDAIDKQKEINDLLSGALSAEDLEAIEEEYEEMMGVDRKAEQRLEDDEEEEDEVVPKLPDVPSQLPKADKGEAERTKKKTAVAAAA